jgi:hypothetical protein
LPVEVDLAQFPRLRCDRCGLVSLVDPTLPLDVRPSLLCPGCRRPLLAPSRSARARRPANPARRRYDPPPVAGGPVPSHAAVGLTIAAIFMLVLIGAFLWLVLTPHQHYWWALTK